MHLPGIGAPQRVQYFHMMQYLEIRYILYDCTVDGFINISLVELQGSGTGREVLERMNLKRFCLSEAVWVA